MKDLVNIQNNNNLTGSYPLFLGQDLGFADTVNITYPELYELKNLMLSQYWVPEEFYLDGDRKDLQSCPDSIRQVMILNLMSQWLLDSVASRSIVETFGAFTTNSELVDLFLVWSTFESIHASAYSLIIRQCFSNPNKIIEDAKKNIKVAYRSRIIGKVFNETNQLAARYTLGEIIPEEVLKKQIFKTVVTLYSLEAISFMASFACTFALTATGKFQGIGNEVALICRDEMIHAKAGRTIADILMKVEGYDIYFEDLKDEIRTIFDEVVKQEMAWSEYIFEDDRHVLGLTTEMLKDYVRFLAKPAYERFGLTWDETRFGVAPKRNPVPYMDQYTDPDSVQAANQEIEQINYRIGAVVDDTTDEIFDF